MLYLTFKRPKNSFSQVIILQLTDQVENLYKQHPNHDTDLTKVLICASQCLSFLQARLENMMSQTD